MQSQQICHELLIKCSLEQQKKITEKQDTYDYQCGIDVYFLEDVTVPANSKAKIDLGISCEPTFTSGYYLVPRSSICKTPLIMCNSVGIIDPDYRGNLIVYVRNMEAEPYCIKKGESLFQIVVPSLTKIKCKFH